jgi:site-specific DNA recombinase
MHFGSQRLNLEKLDNRQVAAGGKSWRSREWEKCALVQKLRASRLRILRAGQRCEGKKPYGHTDEEKKVVDSILDYRKCGNSYVAIAQQLNTDGIKSRSGKLWHPTQIQRVL